MAETPWLVNKDFTAASVAKSASSTSCIEIPLSQAIGEGPSGAMNLGTQALRTFVQINDAAGTATLEFCITHLVSNVETVVYSEVGTCTVTARESNLDGATDGYWVMGVSWAVTGRDTIDLFGMLPGCKAYLYCTAVSSGETVRVRVAGTRNAG